MLKWRLKHKMDTIKHTRQPPFFDILTHYPHFVWGYSNDGCAVCYELLGMYVWMDVWMYGCLACIRTHTHQTFYLHTLPIPTLIHIHRSRECACSAQCAD
ncbi:hypothetical protein EON63_24980 [archaeon]|nr:MAG: hypothetical protein EON63_24980 [archaeon]